MTTTERDRRIAPAEPVFSADTFAAAIAGAWWDDAVMLGGWALGARAFAEKAPPRALMAELAALEDRALEVTLDRVAGEHGAGGDALLHALRPLRAAAALLHASAVEAFAHGALRGFQADAREVRHELRNPIGTIRNALSMLQESSPARGSVADHPSGERLQAIALRGAAAIEGLVRDRLTATVAADVFLGRGTPASAMLAQLVDAVGVRARGAGVAVTAASTSTVGTVRALGLDLVLRSALVAAVRSAASGSRVDVELLPGGDHHASIRVRPERAAHATPELLASTRELADLAGLTLTGSLDEGVCVQAEMGEGSGRQ